SSLSAAGWPDAKRSRMFFSSGISSLRTNFFTRSRSIRCSSLTWYILRLLSFADTLVHELERIGPGHVQPPGQHVDVDHRVVEILPARVAHGANAAGERVARPDDTLGVQLLDRMMDAIVGLLRIV